jgi:hypothetical protein
MRWLKARGHMPLDLFVEHMTFEEARWYTKRVVSSYATYRFLYAGGERGPRSAAVFPAHAAALRRPSRVAAPRSGAQAEM